MKTTKLRLEDIGFYWNCWKCGKYHAFTAQLQGLHHLSGKLFADATVYTKGYAIVKCTCGRKRKIVFPFKIEFEKLVTHNSHPKLKRLMTVTREKELAALKASLTTTKKKKKEVKSVTPTLTSTIVSKKHKQKGKAR